MEEIMKVVKSLEESGLSLKGVSKQFKMKLKKQKGVFLKMLTRLLGNMLAR